MLIKMNSRTEKKLKTVSKWLESLGFKVHLKQELRGRKNRHIIDVLAVRKNISGGNDVYLVHLKDFEKKVPEETVSKIISSLEDLIYENKETKFGTVEGMVVVSPTGFAQYAIDRVERMDAVSCYCLDRGIWPELYHYSDGDYKRVAGNPKFRITDSSQEL